MGQKVSSVLAVILLTAVPGCNRVEPKVSDKVLQKIRHEEPGITGKCMKKIKFGGFEAMPSRVDQCFEMTPEQPWRGLWRNDFEGETFCPAPAEKCPSTNLPDMIWPTFGPGGQPPVALGSGGLYAIEFVGRRTLQKGHHGHMGMFDHEILVDKLISLRQLETPYDK